MNNLEMRGLVLRKNIYQGRIMLREKQNERDRILLNLIEEKIKQAGLGVFCDKKT